MFRKTAALLLLLALASFPLARAEETRYAQVFDREQDAGNLTIRFLWLGEQVAEDTSWPPTRTSIILAG